MFISTWSSNIQLKRVYVEVQFTTSWEWRKDHFLNERRLDIIHKTLEIIFYKGWSDVIFKYLHFTRIFVSDTVYWTNTWLETSIQRKQNDVSIIWIRSLLLTDGLYIAAKLGAFQGPERILESFEQLQSWLVSKHHFQVSLLGSLWQTLIYLRHSLIKDRKTESQKWGNVRTRGTWEWLQLKDNLNTSFPGSYPDLSLSLSTLLHLQQ